MSRTEYRREDGRLIVATYFDRIELEPEIVGAYNAATGDWEVLMPDSLREELERHGRWVRLTVTVTCTSSAIFR